LGDFYAIFRVYGELHNRSPVKIWADLIEEFRSYWGLNLWDAFSPKCPEPPSGKAVCLMLKRFTEVGMVLTTSITVPSLVEIGLYG